MPQEDECKHGLNPLWCSICKHGPQKIKPEPELVASFRAKYISTCWNKDCQQTIEPGQVVVKLSDGSIYHEYCSP